MSTFNAVGSALYSTLSGGTALTALLAGTTSIYNARALEGAVLPYVVFTPMGGGALNQTPSDMRELVYQVRGFAGTQKLAGQIDAQVSNLLHKKSLTVTGYTNLWTRRDTDIFQTETQPNGEPIYSAGALYRIMLDD